MFCLTIEYLDKTWAADDYKSVNYKQLSLSFFWCLYLCVCVCELKVKRGHQKQIAQKQDRPTHEYFLYFENLMTGFIFTLVFGFLVRTRMFHFPRFGFASCFNTITGPQLWQEEKRKKKKLPS